jgi:hypothetical protein
MAESVNANIVFIFRVWFQINIGRYKFLAMMDQRATIKTDSHHQYPSICLNQFPEWA